MFTAATMQRDIRHLLHGLVVVVTVPTPAAAAVEAGLH
jgi:hypothetical protein